MDVTPPLLVEGRSLCAVTHLATARRQKNRSRHFGAYEKIDLYKVYFFVLNNKIKKDNYYGGADE